MLQAHKNMKSWRGCLHTHMDTCVHIQTLANSTTAILAGYKHKLLLLAVTSKLNAPRRIFGYILRRPPLTWKCSSGGRCRWWCLCLCLCWSSWSSSWCCHSGCSCTGGCCCCCCWSKSIPSLWPSRYAPLRAEPNPPSG